MKSEILKSVFIMAALLLAVSAAQAMTRTVDDDGSQPYTSIQAAINDSSADDIVYVYPGVYHEQITMKNRVNVVGYGPHVTTIDGDGSAIHVVDFGGTDGAVLSGFRIIGSAPSPPNGGGTWHYSGVHVRQGSLTIRNNIIEGNHAGIAVQAGANPTIINNTIVDNKNGIILNSKTAFPASEFDVAVIYKTDNTAANNYKEILAASGMSSEVIQMNDVTRTNFRRYRAIIACTDTGSLGNWGTEQGVDTILNSQRPVLGFGYGGSSLFTQMNLSINWGNSAISFHKELSIVTPLDPVFNVPNDIPKGKVLGLYNVDAGVVEVFTKNIPGGAVRLGIDPGNDSYYPLVREGMHTLWGFTASPAELTQVGQDLFINVVRNMVTNCYRFPAPQIIATGGRPGAPGYTEYTLSVTNWYVYPDEMFEASPDLPPCGLNNNASRTWVNIYADGPTYLYGYCGFDSASDLTKLSFSYPDDEELPSLVYVRLEDRRCDLLYFSNLVTPQLEPYYTHTIMNNIIVNNNNGIFYYHYLGDGQILYNDVWGNSKNYHDNHTPPTATFVPQPGTGEISANPLFADTIDYHLGDGSPCRDTGHPGPVYFDPDGTRNDMGAYGGPESSGQGSHPGSGFIFTTIGYLPTSEIEQDPCHPSHGLAVVDPCVAAALSITQYKDAPFGSTLRVHGLFGETDIDVTGVRYYQILLAPWDGPGDPPEPEDYSPMTSSLSKIQYIPQGDGTVLVQLVNLGAKTIKGVPHCFELTYEGWWSNIDLRALWHTRGYANGKYTMTYKAYRDHPTIPDTLEDVTSLITSNDLDHITLLVDNSPVDVNIHSVKYDPCSPNWEEPNDGKIPECGIINLQNDTENLRFTITAYHPNGYLRHWKLDALYGKNKNAGVIAQDTYPGVVPPNNWYGVLEEEFDSADGSLIPWKRCAYQFRLRAYTRATNGLGYLYSTVYKYHDTFSDHYFIDFEGACSWCNRADVDGSGKIDFRDVARVGEFWLHTCGTICP